MDHTLACFWNLPWTLLLLYLPPQEVHGFFPNFWSRAMTAAWGSITHQDMTEEAILNVTLRLFMEMPHPEKKRIREEDFKDRTLLADDLFAAFYGPEVSAKRFRGAIAQVANANAAMDFLNTTRDDPVLHFDSELIHSANAWLLQARKEVLQAVRSEQYSIARERLGQLLHSLQDFYSHSNWVELGNQQIHPDLVRPGWEIKSIAEAGIRTCRDCSDWTCKGNLLEGLTAKRLLTTGYYGTQPEKPLGKCSHGGKLDGSSHREPRGGINKDSSSWIFSPHHYLHSKAAVLAQDASTHFLETLRRQIGSKQFMRLLDISPATGLSFVVDTTGSMGEEINAAKLQALHIIRQRRGTLQEPDFYLLVPFHDPGFGPVHKTSDPEEFHKIFDDISPLGGGDEPEMCLSALQLALQNSPPYSEIFVFTDASAKDAHLKNSVEALIREQKCKVTFLITEDPSRTRVKRETLAPDRFSLYISLAHSSGGQIIFTDNENIKRMVEIVGESTISTVTLFRHQKGSIFSHKGSRKRTKKQATPLEHHRFWIDSMVEKVVVTIQGAIQDFSIINPKGISHATASTTQSSLATVQSIGGIYRVFLSSSVLAGEWTLALQPRGHYSVHIQGQSTFDFLYYFAVPVDGPHPGFFMMNSLPREGLPTYLVVMAMGLNRSKSGSIQLQAVSLEGKKGSLGELKLQGTNRSALFTAELPQDLLANSSFSVVLRGMDSEGQKVERAAPQVDTAVGSLLELSRDTPVFPGKPVSVAWKLTNLGSSKLYNLEVSCVPPFPVTISSSRHHLGRNQTATGQISMTVPNATAPGSVITITLQANLLHPAGDSTFAHIHLLVMPQTTVPMSSPPHCNVTWVDSSCGPVKRVCQIQRWTATLRILDEAGVRWVQEEWGTVVPHQADGLAESVTYSSDCCLQQAKLMVTNLLGEKYWCHIAAPPPVSGKGATMLTDGAGVLASAATDALCWWLILTAFMAAYWLR
ncbi:von Willebrand factor A domain-containing protein 7 isoform X2 [Hemicordylus capensis]|uniref:von Willebrand factor A domain-containing protein 7 isoform X2 n=1 Tax=Hemicordylus capensis TaxID=884348 RepID=UPI002302FEB0|nr:von Willebrand factor A domain-containing protein 7 isoform X2 [Hemicordylus capensis]